jgi:Ca-activated chloride channel homolog
MGRPVKFVLPAIFFCLLAEFLSSSVRGQSSAVDHADANGESQIDQMPTTRNQIRVGANEVVAAVTVRDKQGEPVLDLSQNDFHVLDNGIEQRIDHWDLGEDPFAVVLVIETSAHVQTILPVVHRAGSIFTETVMALSGEAAVITYDDEVDIRQPLTMDHGSIETAIETIASGSLGMRLYDAMSRANSLLESEPLSWRRVMLVIGEAQDSGSTSKLGEVLREAQLSNTTIYAIGVSSIAADLRYGPKRHRYISSPPNGGADLGALGLWLVELGTNEAHNHALEVSAAATGGTHYRTLKDKTIQNALDNIGGELHTQYNLSYQPSGDAQPGFHEIKVTVSRPGVTVRTRPGYFLAATGN